jgi:hypothetical protein
VMLARIKFALPIRLFLWIEWNSKRHLPISVISWRNWAEGPSSLQNQAGQSMALTNYASITILVSTRLIRLEAITLEIHTCCSPYNIDSENKAQTATLKSSDLRLVY